MSTRRHLDRRLRPLLAAALLLILLPACGAGSDGEARETSPPPATASVPFDRAFIDAMVPHHQEAIEMARAARARGLTQPDLARIAADVIASQQAEIDRMLAWREQWFGSRELGPVLPEVLGVAGHELGMGHGTPDSIRDSDDPDATFAKLMVPHHEGAVAMAEQARKRAQHAELRELAEAVIAAQEREIELLRPHADAEHHG